LFFRKKQHDEKLFLAQNFACEHDIYEVEYFLKLANNIFFMKEFVIKKNTKHYFCLREWENNNISWTALELERITGGKQFF
jgi:hypothetical protein